MKPPLFFFFIVLGLSYGRIPLNFKVSKGEIIVDDIGTGIPDIQTLFNNNKFSVKVVLSWSELDTPVDSSSELLKWTMFVDGVLTTSGEEALDESRSLPDTISAGESVVKNSGRHVIEVEMDLDGKIILVQRRYQSFAAGASFIPLIVILSLVIATYMVKLSLVIGIFVGACMISGTIISGFKQTLDTYVLGALADVDHGYVYLITLFMSGFVGMIEKSGGLLGFTESMSKMAKTSRSGQLAAFGTNLMIFFDDYANVLVTGSAMRPILDSLHVSREKLSFIVDATAVPIVNIIPVSIWTGFEVGLIQPEINKIIADVGENNLTIERSGFGVLLKTIQYRYYLIFMIFLIPLLIVTCRDYGAMLVAERKVIVYGRTDGGPGATQGAGEIKLEDKITPNPDTPCKAWNMLLSIGFLIFYVFYLLVQTGHDGSGEQTFLEIMQNSNSYSALLWGTMAAVLTTMGFFMLQFKQKGKLVKPTLHSLVPTCLTKCFLKMKGKSDTQLSHADKYAPKLLMTPREGMDSFLAGMEKVFTMLIILTLAWASGAVMVAVGLDRVFSQIIISSDFDYRMLPTISFVIAALIALAMGTSWGAMTILYPLLLVPTYKASNGSPTNFYATTASILSGSVVGDHLSPMSDTTVLSALATECQLLNHIKTRAPYVLMVVVWSISLGTIPIGMEAYPNGVAIFLGFVFTVLTVAFLAVKVVSETGRYDLFTELYLCFLSESELHELKKDTVIAFKTNDFVDSPMKNKDEEKGVEEDLSEERDYRIKGKPSDDTDVKLGRSSVKTDGEVDEIPTSVAPSNTLSEEPARVMSMAQCHIAG